MNDTTLPPENGTSKQQSKGVAVNARKEHRPAPRKGFGLHDWNLLVRSAKDLAQRKGQPLRKIKKEEIKQHKTIYDGWMILQDKVYYVSPYLAYHPGGEDIMKKVLGRDATKLFDKYHPWVNTDGLIGTLLIGYVDNSRDNDSEDDDDDVRQSPYLPGGVSDAAGAKDKDGFSLPIPRAPKN